MASDTAPFEFLWVVKESAYGTTKNTPVAGTDSIYIRLDGANRFDMRPKKVTRAIPFGGGYAVRGYTVSDHDETMGKLDLTLCYSQAKLLLDWGITKINGSNPWTTTEPPGDLASCSVFHGIKRDDGTIKRRKYKGVKVAAGKLSGSADTGIVTLSMNLRAQKYDGNTRESTSDPDATAFPAPADTAFPTDPLLFYQTNGAISLNGSTVSYPESVDLSWNNAMDWRYFNSYFPAFDRLRGRASQLDMRVLYTASPDWRGLYEALTAMAGSVAFTNGTNTVTLSYNANNIIDPAPTDDLTPGRVYMQTFSLQNQYDTSAGTDITFTYA